MSWGSFTLAVVLLLVIAAALLVDFLDHIDHDEL